VIRTKRDPRNEIIRAALGVAVGIALVLLGEKWLGGFLILLALLLVVNGWRSRYLRPIDPQFLAEIESIRKLEKPDPAAADKLIERAISDADQREQRELADLRRRASSDPQAAIELRNWLRGKLKIWESARRKAEKGALDRPDDHALLKEMDRQASDIEKELAQVEQNVERFRTE
jgi:hypothetical protein